MRSVSGHQLARLLGDWQRHDTHGPAYARLAAAIRLFILDGRLPLESKLPGERELAGALGISRTTVTAAYDLLRSGGYATSRQGSGTSTALPVATTHTSDPGAATWAPFGPDGSDLVDMAHAAPEAPAQTLREAYDTAMSRLPRELPGCGYSLFGLPELRSAVAARFTVRGLPTAPDQILVTNGTQHAFFLVLSLLLNPGDRVLVEHPTYPNALDAIRRLNGRPVPVAMTEDGWDVDAVTAALRQTAPRMAYLIPDFQNPTGLLASESERRALALALSRTRTMAVVDETLTELPLEGDVPPPLAAYLDTELAVTIGSISKSFWGGLRIGWVRGSAATVRRLAAVRATFDISSPVLDQLTAAALLSRLDDALPARRAQLRERRDILVAALAEQLPHWRIRVPSGGLVLWCDMGRPVSSRLVAAAASHALRLAAGPRFGVDGAFERRLRLPYTLPGHTLRHGVALLGQAYTAVVDGGWQRPDPFADLVA